MLMDLEVLAAIILVMIVPLFWLTTLITALLRKFDNPSEKLVWVIVILFLPFIGAILFWLIGAGAISKFLRFSILFFLFIIGILLAVYFLF